MTLGEVSAVGRPTSNSLVQNISLVHQWNDPLRSLYYIFVSSRICCIAHCYSVRCPTIVEPLHAAVLDVTVMIYVSILISLSLRVARLIVIQEHSALSVSMQVPMLTSTSYCSPNS